MKALKGPHLIGRTVRHAVSDINARKTLCGREVDGGVRWCWCSFHWEPDVRRHPLCKRCRRVG